MPKVMLAGGGTGGHLFPAIALAEELKRRKPDVEILFVGTKRGLEAKLIPQMGYRLLFLEVRGLRRKVDVRNLLFFYYLARSLRQAKSILEIEKPDVVVGTGGYVSGPPLYCARRLKIPTIIQEQNSYPGLTTRWLAKGADKVFLAYPESKRYFKRQNNLEVVGNPVRCDFNQIDKAQAKKSMKIDQNKKVILILGGSQGSVALNQSILENLALLEGQSWLQIIWQTGERDYSRIKATLDLKNLPITAMSFIQDMGTAYAACDLVVSRAGALTLSEITLCGKPSLLIPYPHAAADHQRHNAEALVKAGAANMIFERDLPGQNLVKRMLGLAQDQKKLESMSAQSIKLGKPDSLHRIVNEILKYINRAEN